ncbi:MAG: InlB B-repeat-containing protein, partial [Candidatus Riflebacteria bacterium]|nr:InlB B-repeat-containing protein [Candidatus Riflebacteria bacterium]
GSMSDQTINENAAAALTANSFTRTGYTFSGWATTSNGSVAYTDGANFTMGTTDVILYARWTQNNHTVTFNANDGIGSMSDQTINENAAAALTANSFTRSGYTFSGWATTSTGSVAYADEANFTMGTTNVILYAKWTAAAKPTVTITAVDATIPPSPFTSSPIYFEVTFSSPVNGFSLTDIDYIGAEGSVGSFVEVSASKYKFSIQGLATYVLGKIDINADVATDQTTGAGNAAAESFGFLFDGGL